MRNHNALCIYIILQIYILQYASCIFEEIEATPTNTNAVELGELSWPQFMLMALFFVKLYLLVALGIWPLEIDLGAPYPLKSVLAGFRTFREQIFGVSDNGNQDGFNINDNVNEINVGRTLSYSGTTPTDSSFMFDCPLQYVCELEHWANEPHDSYFGNYIASWFKTENGTFTNTKGRTFGGMGSCVEMYPCPFDVHDFAGVRVPGAPYNHNATNNYLLDDDMRIEREMDFE